MRKEPDLAGGYKKDLEDEKFLERLNSILLPHQERDYQDLEEIYPTLHIIGAPRSGTTLLSQLISSHLDIGYINNLIAAFWQAPVYGIKLSRKLIPSAPPSSYHSDFGRTSGIHEPHEFGYFWFSLLNYKEMHEQAEDFEKTIEWDYLRCVITNMTYAFGRPIVFKPLLLGWHIRTMQETLSKTCFVRIRRDPLENAISILHFREKYLGSAEEWVSMKPLEYEWLKNEPYWKQVAGQVYYLEKSMTKQIEEVNYNNILDITYEEVCHDPKLVLKKVINMLDKNGKKIGFVSDPPRCFTIHKEREISPTVRDLVKISIEEFYGSLERLGKSSLKS